MFKNLNLISSKILKLKGFSTLWVTVIVIFLTFAIIVSFTTEITLLNNKQKITRRNMLVVEKAMSAFLLENKRLPCPSPLNRTYSQASYGEESLDVNDICGKTKGGIQSDGIIFIGAVPAKVLDIPLKYTLDGWGNKITYAVDKLYAKEYTDSSNTSGWKDEISANIVIKNKDIIVTNESIYVLISHGPNAYGAFGGFSNRQNPLSGNIYELDNIYRESKQSLNNIFYINSVDDIVVYHSPNQKETIVNKFDKKISIDGDNLGGDEGDSTIDDDGDIKEGKDFELF